MCVCVTLSLSLSLSTVASGGAGVTAHVKISVPAAPAVGGVSGRVSGGGWVRGGARDGGSQGERVCVCV